MAGTIKGMTIEIGGDTAPLNQALKETNKEINATQKDLKEVEKLLKLDPHNTELLAEKQKLLSKSVEQTSDKLEALKKAKQDADKKMQNGTEVNSEEYRKLQKEIITTQAQLKKYNEELDNSSKKMDLLGKNAEKMNSAMKVAGIGVLGLGAGLVKSAFDAGKAADEINTLAKQTGLSTEQIQKFQFASETIDVSLETLTGSMSKLIKSMDSASKESGDTYEAFEKLGVSVVGTDGKLRNNQDVFKETIKALGQIENETERDATAMRIFGKSAQELNPLIKGGADELENLGQKAEEMGLILSQDALDNANAFQDGIDTLKATVSASFQEVGAKMTEYLIPVVEKAAKLAEWVLDNKEQIVSALAAIVAGIAAFNMVVMIQNMVQAFQAWKVATEGMTVAQAALNAVMNLNPIALLATLLAGLIAYLVTAIKTNEEFRQNLIYAWEDLKYAAENLIGKVVKFFKEDIPNAFNAVINFVKDNWQSLLLLLVNPFAGAIKLLYDLNPQFHEWVDNLLQSIKDWFKGVYDIGKNVVEGLWNGIKDMKEWLKAKIRGLGDLIVDALKSVLGISSPSRVMEQEVGKYLAEGIGVGFEETMPAVIDDMQDKISNVTDALQTELSIGDIPEIKGNQIISENQYVTKNYNNTVETIRQPSVIELVLDDTKVARALIPALDSEYNRLGLKV